MWPYSVQSLACLVHSDEPFVGMLFVANSVDLVSIVLGADQVLC